MIARAIAAFSLMAACSTAAIGQQAPSGTIDVGKTGWAAKRPVVASACPFGCPWGELGEFVHDAMTPLGYDVILCRNCNRDRGPRLVSAAATEANFAVLRSDHETKIGNEIGRSWLAPEFA
jgi:hypothetical protein